MASTTTFLHLPYTARSAAQAGSVRRQRRAHVLATVFVAFALAIPAAGASSSARSGDPTADARAKREEIRRQKAALASEIDLVKASDDDVANALNTIDLNVRAQEAKVADAKRAIEDDDRRIEDLKVQIEQSKADIAGVETAVRKRAIETYVNPAGSFDSTKFLKSSDLDQAEQRKVLAETVTGNDHDIVDQLKASKAQLAELERQTNDAKAAAEKHHQDEQDQLDDLAAARADQAKVKAEWDKRLSGLRDDDAALNSADADLTAQIQQLQAEQAAREEANRQAQAAAAAAQASRGTTSSSRNGGGSSSTSSPGGNAPTSSSSSRPATSGGLIWPIAGRVSQEFGVGGHPGMDIFAPCGTPTYAAKGGTVIVAGMNNGGYGNLVVIDHGGGFSTAYAHHQSLTVSVGQTVSQGQQVGLEGSTGYSTGCHLHFETRVNGSVQNPRNYLP